MLTTKLTVRLQLYLHVTVKTPDPKSISAQVVKVFLESSDQVVCCPDRTKNFNSLVPDPASQV